MSWDDVAAVLTIIALLCSTVAITLSVLVLAAR
jgi:hypothetical protein